MSERATSERVRPSTVLIAAMGGEGGGVLTAWLVNAARKHGLPVQATSIPGVAQRTGATAYYIEICPVPYAELGGKEPVMDLFPGPGDIDLMVATELVETGRAMEKGFVDPDRTTLIASTHRIFTMSEKMAMGDGRFDSEKIVDGAKKMSKRAILFDMEKAAQDSGSIINSVILGAIAGSGVLPIPSEVFEKGIEEEGKAVKQNLAGFKAGLAYARGEILEARPKKVARPIPVPAAPPLSAAAVALKTRIEQTYPASIQPIVLTAAARCFDFQNARYAKLYLDRLDQILEIEKAQNSRDFLMTQETARHLGLRMTFEDLIRVAQLKSRASRLDRVRREVEATPDQVVKVTEFMKPGIEEFCSLLPSFVAKPLLRWAEKHPKAAKKTHIGMYVRTDTIWGFAKVRTVAKLRFARRMGHRYKTEQKMITAWLDLVKASANFDRALALEVIECARLIKGYGDTHKRGAGNFTRIVHAVIIPAIDNKRHAAELVKKARDAALADPDGNSLSKALGEASAEALSAMALPGVKPKLAATS